MKLKIENAGPCRKSLKVEVPVEQVNAQWDSTLALYTSSARLDGFRKGKAPSALIATHYSRDIADDVGDHLLRKSYLDAIEQEKLAPVAVIKIDHPPAARDQVFTITFILDVPPDFKLPKYKQLALRGNKIEITEEAVEKRIKDLLENMPEYHPVEARAARQGDAVRIDFEAFLDGQPLAKAVPEARHLAAGKDIWWDINSEPSIIPGLSDALIGMEQGRQKNVSTFFDKDSSVKALIGRTVEYRILLKLIHERKTPVLDESFLKKIKVESEAVFREKIRNMLTLKANDEERERLRNLALKTLLSKTSIEVPESLVQDETRNMFYSMVRRRAMDGMTADQLAGQRQELMGEAAAKASDMVKLGYILLRIADEEKLEVTDEEYAAELKNLANRAGKPLEDFKKQIEEGGDESSIRNEMRLEKAITFILDHAEVQTEGFIGRLISGVTGRKETT